jgi:hypothetical protein
MNRRLGRNHFRRALLFLPVGLLMGLLLPSCEVTGLQDTRRPILDGLGQVVRLQFDWSQSGLAPSATGVASVWFFPIDGDAPRVLRTNRERDSIYLPPNVYHVLAFDGTEDYGDHAYIAFRGMSSYETFEAYAKPLALSSRFAPRAAEFPDPAYTPGLLAVARDTIEVARRTNGSEPPSFTFAPRPATGTLTITAHLKDMIYTAESGHALSIGGMAAGVMLATGRPTTEPVTHYAPLNHRTFDVDEAGNSTTDGSMWATLPIFGLSGAGSNYLQLSFILRDSNSEQIDEFVVERDVTGHFNQAGAGGVNVQMAIVLDLTVGLGQETWDPPIVAPYAPPGGSGFVVDVGGWGPIIDIGQQL